MTILRGILLTTRYNWCPLRYWRHDTTGCSLRYWHHGTTGCSLWY